jgi:hypothetical protein
MVGLLAIGPAGVLIDLIVGAIIVRGLAEMGWRGEWGSPANFYRNKKL